MTTLTVAEISAGLSIGHAIKGIYEVSSVNNKVNRLSDILLKRALKPFPANINTRLKAYASLFGMFVLVSLIAFFVLRWINPSLRVVIWIAAGAALLSEVIYVVGLDRYHVNIGKVTKLIQKK